LEKRLGKGKRCHCGHLWKVWSAAYILLTGSSKFSTWKEEMEWLQCHRTIGKSRKRQWRWMMALAYSEPHFLSQTWRNRHLSTGRCGRAFLTARRAEAKCRKMSIGAQSPSSDMAAVLRAVLCIPCGP
jgi:hypothetical protein